MIQVNDLTFRYPNATFELRVDDLQITRGSRVAFVGPSGSGKTTLLHLLAGIFLPEEGSIEVGDTRITTLGDSARRAFRISQIGFVFQNFELMEYLNVRENILLPYFINRALRLNADARQMAESLASSMGLGDKLNRHAGRLSQGEQQRVAICRSLVTSPQLMLADEPTGNLDPTNKLRTIDVLLEQASRHDATLVVVTHDESLLDRFDQVIPFDDFCHST